MSGFRLTRRPVRAALIGMLPMVVVGVLPAQVRWADTLTQADDGILTTLRLMTVSPTFLYGGRGGAEAWVQEIVWAVLFLGLLLSAGRCVTRRIAGPFSRPAVLGIAAVVFAPAANLLVLLVLDVPRFLTEPALRGITLSEALHAAQRDAAHAMVIAMAGAVTALLALSAADAEEYASRAPSGAGPWDLLRFALFRARETLLQRIGGTLLSTCGAMLVLGLSGSQTAEDLVAFLVARLSAGGLHADIQIQQVTAAVVDSLPGTDSPQVDPAVYVFAGPWAWQCFAIMFAACYFSVRSYPDVRPGSVTTLLATWFGYTLGAVVYAFVLAVPPELARQDSGLTSREGLGLLITSGGLQHALLAAPFAAGVLACCRLAYGRLRAMSSATRPHEDGLDETKPDPASRSGDRVVGPQEKVPRPPG